MSTESNEPPSSSKSKAREAGNTPLLTATEAGRRFDEAPPEVQKKILALLRSLMKGRGTKIVPPGDRPPDGSGDT